ncbi:hypothetical protein Tco_0465935 [Tanacetum coccineum]
MDHKDKSDPRCTYWLKLYKLGPLQDPTTATITTITIKNGDGMQRVRTLRETISPEIKVQTNEEELAEEIYAIDGESEGDGGEVVVVEMVVWVGWQRGEGVAEAVEARAGGDRIDREWIYLFINFGFAGVWPENFSGDGGLVAGGGGSSSEKEIRIEMF